MYVNFCEILLCYINELNYVRKIKDPISPAIFSIVFDSSLSKD